MIWRQLRKPVGKVQPPLRRCGKGRPIKGCLEKNSGNEDLTGKEFCLGLSNLVRCLQYRFNFPAVDYTTEEILKILPKYKLTDDEFVAAEKCLKTCDRVLYADANLTGRDNLRRLLFGIAAESPKNIRLLPRRREEHEGKKMGSFSKHDLPEETEQTTAVVDAAYSVHREMGPGLLESIYESCLAKELERGYVALKGKRVFPFFMVKDLLDEKLWLDLIVGDKVILEVKAVEELVPVHEAQLLTYLKLTGV